MKMTRLPKIKMSDFKRMTRLMRFILENIAMMHELKTIPDEAAVFDKNATKLNAQAEEATSSQRMRALADRAEYLLKQSEIMLLIARVMKIMSSDQITAAQNAEIINRYAGAWQSTLTYFHPLRNMNTTNWEEYAERVKRAKVTLNAIREELHEVRYAEEVRRDALLPEPVDQNAKLPVQKHDSFIIRMKRHDYFYYYSDALTVYNHGEQQRNEIMAITKLHPHYLKLWEVYSASQGLEKPSPAPLYEQLRQECAFL